MNVLYLSSSYNYLTFSILQVMYQELLQIAQLSETIELHVLSGYD